VPTEWKGVFATAVYTGMRKGEIFGLLKSDVDLENRIRLIAQL
jgi:integrase